MSTPGALRRKNGSAAVDPAAAAPGRTLGRSDGGAAAAAAAAAGGGLPFGRGGLSTPPSRSLGLGPRGVGLPPSARARGRGGGSVAAPTTLPATEAFSMDGGGFPSSLWASTGFSVDPSSPGSWGQDVRPPGGFMSYFANEAENSHLVGTPIHSSPLNEAINAGSPPDVQVVHGNENTRTAKRIMWNVDEEVRLMSAWIEHSTDSTCGADKGGVQYWSEVVETYNKTTPAHRRRTPKQCKDRWHKVNRLTDLFECAYVKARRVFTSGYSNEQWMEAAHGFYLSDNKDNKDVVGPFMLEKVWKICRDVPKWKTYNDNLKNALRPIGQKAAKMAALAAKKGKGSSSSEDGQSKESPIELDKFERYSKFQETNNDKRMKMLDRQEKIASDKLEATRIAQLTAQDYKEGKKFDKEIKMMETYNNLASQDTSSMSDEEKAQRVRMMQKLENAIFPQTD
ncbi:unnamed protein product [Urochloa decumbens]|uniref:Myb-like domain-containing protein n=1 Tax=Urochloa decumbens TaxID=240449 RepID=A0ABC8WUJ8_9POAL